MIQYLETPETNSKMEQHLHEHGLITVGCQNTWVTQSLRSSLHSGNALKYVQVQYAAILAMQKHATGFFHPLHPLLNFEPNYIPQSVCWNASHSLAVWAAPQSNFCKWETAEIDMIAKCGRDPRCLGRRKCQQRTGGEEQIGGRGRGQTAPQNDAEMEANLLSGQWTDSVVDGKLRLRLFDRSDTLERISRHYRHHMR